jgi:sulfoxide reductase catalytic subunit YedY
MKKFKYSEITPEKVYNKRREFVKSMGLSLGSLTLSTIPGLNQSYANTDLSKLTSYEDVTTYNNYYEFGTGKSDPYNKSQSFKTEPWNISIEGEVEETINFSIEEILTTFNSEERVQRLRCVEGWSMIIPWMGFSLSELLNKVKIKPEAKYVKFISVFDPEQMVGQRRAVLNWPYVEGLRLDEAMHPLTTVVTGLYGKTLPNQNGAPLRIFIPWKYGFKSGKAIVKIELVKDMPTSSWMRASPREYGFYSNVNPNVNHPRWSQATERVIGADIFAPRIKTLMFNGYGDEVANLYSGMDLKKNF